MANAFHGDRFLLDTNGNNIVATLASHLTFPIRTKGMRWINATTADHRALVTYATGSPLWESISKATNLGEPDESRIKVLLTGDFNVTINSGVLYIYLDV